MTPEQTRFLWLHARTNDSPSKWKWHFGDSLLRAYTDKGQTATISRDGLAALVERGLIVMLGCAGVRLTDTGRMEAAR